VLILGASGYIGGALHEAMRADDDVVGTCFRHSSDPGLIRLDLRDHHALAELAQAADLVINTAGVVSPDAAEQDPDFATAVNVHAVDVLAGAVRSGTKIVQLSTDNVFDGTQDYYFESDPISPTNVYGTTKAEAEAIVLRDPANLVIRLPMVFGFSPTSDSFISRFDSDVVKAQTDIVLAPLYLPSLAGQLRELCEYQGLLHFAGPDIVTRYELMSQVASALALTSSVQPVLQSEMGLLVTRPPRLVLRSERHEIEGTALVDALADMRRQLLRS
jgi:dTDP-4-dehydrorhamnose reductase